jgi:hypothetical protein
MEEEIKDLLRKELEVNLEEQKLIERRIETMKEAINDIPKEDPEYYTLDEQILADQIQLDEHKIRQDALLQQLHRHTG